MMIEIEEEKQRDKRHSAAVQNKERIALKIVLQDRDYEVLLRLNEMGPQDAALAGLMFSCQVVQELCFPSDVREV